MMRLTGQFTYAVPLGALLLVSACGGGSAGGNAAQPSSNPMPLVASTPVVSTVPATTSTPVAGATTTSTTPVATSTASTTPSATPVAATPVTPPATTPTATTASNTATPAPVVTTPATTTPVATTPTITTPAAKQCAHPDTGALVNGGATYTYYTVASGTQSQCDAAKATSTCQASSGAYSPVVVATRFAACAVSVPAVTPPVTPPVASGKVRVNIAATGGQNFGVGPSVKFWFSGRNPNAATNINLNTDIEIGTTFATDMPAAHPWKYWYDSRSKRYYTPTVDNLETGAANRWGNNDFQYTVDLGKAFAQQEGYLISFRFVIPDNYFFPGTDANFWNGSNMSVGSSFKMAWVMKTVNNDTGNSDLILLNHAGGGALTTQGNGMSVYTAANPADTHWFSGLETISRTDNSNRLLSHFQHGAGVPSGGNGRVEWSLVSTLAHTYTNAIRPVTYTNSAKPATDPVEPPNHHYVNFPGWMDTTRNGRGNEQTAQTLYGDVYVAQGPTAKARLEIGDAATY